jgi:hypothetical protein
LQEDFLMQWIGKGGVALFLISLVPHAAHAQAAAASASAGSAQSSAGVSASIDKMKPEKADKSDKAEQASVLAAAPAANSNTSPHMVATSGPPPEEVNRKALEDRAGTDAGKLFLRSTPTGAQILIDGAFVGRTPLLLVVPPGKYKIEMRGTRAESATTTIGLLANKTQEVALSLKQLYPATVTTK